MPVPTVVLTVTVTLVQQLERATSTAPPGCPLGCPLGYLAGCQGGRAIDPARAGGRLGVTIMIRMPLVTGIMIGPSSPSQVPASTCKAASTPMSVLLYPESH
jgi:hypothetical protein